MREFELLEHIYAGSRDLPPSVTIGPGDDLALVELGDRRLLAGVDQVVAGRHVRLETTAIELVGRKAMTRSLSDVAAMAGVPVGALVAATLPPDLGQEQAARLFDAMRVVGAEFACPLIGGDIAFHAEPGSPLVCSVTVLATPAGASAITRGGAAAGDGVYVTGRLGGSFDRPDDGRHLTFVPRVTEAIELIRELGPALHAMIDVSDGLGRDAAHIAESSDVRLVVEADLIPCTAGVPWQRAVADGEDYELLFTAAGPVPTSICGTSITRVGSVVARDDGSACVQILADGALFDAAELGWQHES